MIERKYFAVDWYDENESGECIEMGTTLFCGTREECTVKWYKISEEHTACRLRRISRTEFAKFYDDHGFNL